MLKFAHDWTVHFDPSGQDPAIKASCDYCAAVVEVLLLERHDGTFLQARLLDEGAHPVTREDVDALCRDVHKQFVDPPSAAAQPDASAQSKGAK